jgi:hypothetical protein
VIRVRTRETLMRPDVASLVMRGANACGVLSSGAALAELARDIALDHIGCFVGFHDSEPQGLLIVQLPTSAFQLGPVVLVAYSEGASRELTHEGGRRMREWIRAAGFDEAVALNLLHPDRAFCRRFAHFGTPERTGSVIKFRLGGTA